jgi:hypothetical protein
MSAMPCTARRPRKCGVINVILREYIGSVHKGPPGRRRRYTAVNHRRPPARAGG